MSNWREGNSVYDFAVKNLDGEEVSLSKYKGKVILIVNIASKCGFAKQNFKELSELHEKYCLKGLTILGFPCDQFGQESRSEPEIKEFLADNNIEWDVFGKINVNGDNSIPLYKWLKHKTESTLFLPKILKWNFTKFLVDKNGQPVARYAPNTSPLSFVEDIERELEK